MSHSLLSSQVFLVAVHRIAQRLGRAFGFVGIVCLVGLATNAAAQARRPVFDTNLTAQTWATAATRNADLVIGHYDAVRGLLASY